MLDIKDLEPKFKIDMELKDGKLNAEIRGNVASLLTGLSILAKKLKENGISEEKIKNAVNGGLMTEEELKQEVDKKIEKLFKNMFDL